MTTGRVLIFILGLFAGIGASLVADRGLRTMPVGGATMVRQVSFAILISSILFLSHFAAPWLVGRAVGRGDADRETLLNLYALGLGPPVLFVFARWWRRI